jgi:hypothetical protein
MRATAYLLRSLLVCTVFLPTILSAQPKVLTEIFSNTACANCKSPDEAYEAFMKNNPSLGIQRIVYHNDFPSPNDTFYNASKVWVTARRNLYGVTSDPSAFINGKTGTEKEALWEGYSKSVGVSTPPITIDVTHNGNGTITIRAKNTATLSAKVRFYIALTESNIIMPNTDAYGEPVSGHWDDIFRMMLPTSGSTPFTATGNDTISGSFDPTEPDNTGHQWNPDNMHAVVFLQDDLASGTPPTRAVRAIGVASLAGGNAVNETAHSVAHLQLRANPAKTFNQLGVQLATASNVRVVALDMLGREVRTLAETNLPEGSSTVQVEPSTFTSGCYVIQLFVNGRVADQQKLIVQ